MPEETNSPSSLTASKAAKEPKVRRVSIKPPKKAEEKNEPKEAKEPKPDVKSERGPNVEESGTSPGNGKPQETKRPNRRRRGKGKAQGNDAEKESAEEAPAMEKGEPKEKPAAQGSAPNTQRPPQPPRRKVAPDKVAKNAWKIYLAEVSEEGVALIGDSDARELARRCFRLAEIFLEEEDRRS
jgi:hypothetical protein